MDLFNYKISDLLPHEPPMVLVDEVLEWKPGKATSAVYINENSLFYTIDKGVPAHVGLEYMAQTCGVYSGIYLRNNKLPVKMGFLLGTRNFLCNTDWFQPGDKLIIQISEVLRQQAIGVFDCSISCNDKELATAQLTVYQSEEVAKQ